jgi:hypothetical protein
MTLQDILAEWKTDSKIDASDLTAESEKLYSLHSKYVDMYSAERLKLKSLEFDERRLKLKKHQFYLQGPSQETKKLGWEYPTSGKVIRQDLEVYTDADKELQEVESQIEIQKTKVETLEFIMDAIKARGYTINSLIRFEIYRGGGNE